MLLIVNDTKNYVLILRNMLYLRLVVLSVMCASLVLVHWLLYPLEYITTLLLLIVLMAFWSLYVMYLSAPYTSDSTSAMLRESIVDALWLFGVVMLSGRSANPFIYYYIVLVAISASLYSTRAAWLYAGAGVLMYSALLYFDISQHFQHFQSDYQLHLVGMWLNFVGSTVVTCFFVNRLASALRLRQSQLEQVREETLKSEQVVGVGTIAASTVHALATPLSTLTILLEGFSQQKKEDDKEDLELMLKQIERCKATMNKLSMLSDEGVLEVEESAESIVLALKEHYLLSGQKVIPQFIIGENCNNAYVSQAILLRHALLNLINNAVDACSLSVLVRANCFEREVVVEIENDGEAFSQEMLQKWGSPMLSLKENGLGIGSFLANSTIEKQGGTVEISQVETSLNSTLLIVRLPCKHNVGSTHHD